MRGGVVVGDQGDGGRRRRIPERGGVRWSLFGARWIGEREFRTVGGHIWLWLCDELEVEMEAHGGVDIDGDDDGGDGEFVWIGDSVVSIMLAPTSCQKSAP